MAGYWSIIVPETTTNLVTNPSIYTDATGFTAVGGSIVRDTTFMRREIACLKITPTSGVNDGAYYGTVSLTSGTTYTFSVDILGVNGEPYKIWFGDTSAVLKGTATTFTAIGDWERQEVTWACNSTASYRLYVTKNNDNNTSNFYIDGLQCEAKSYATTYCDGNQEGCKWIGAEHASTSTRDAQSRAGGKLVNFDDYGFYIDDMPGIGMPPILHQTQEQPMLPGSLLRGFKTKPRVFDLIANQIGTTHEDLHSKRKDLLNAIKPDLVLEPQPFILQYTGANSTKPIQIKAVYDSGYQFTQLDGFTEKQLPLRFIAYNDPFFYEVGDVAATLTTSQTLSSILGITAKIDNSWEDFGPPSSGGSVTCLLVTDDYLYIGGGFDNWNSIANADRIARYDLASETWSAMGTGADANVYEIVEAPNGDIYIAGAFTGVGGVANTNGIARWDGSAWNAVGSGLYSGGNGLAFDSDGNLYIGGGETAGHFLSKWDGSSWSVVGTLNNPATAIVFDKADNMYIGGSFTTIDSDPYNRIAKYDGNTWSTLSSGMSNTVFDLLVSPNGYLYACGRFITAGGLTVNGVARWNGSAWAALGTGTNSDVETTYPEYLALDNDGQLYMVGYFRNVGGLTVMNRMAIWNGTTWSPMDINFLPDSDTVTVHSIFIKGIDIYIGVNSNATSAVSSYSNTITNNGTRSVYPKIVIERSGGTSASIQFIKNETTGAVLYFDYSLLNGEKIELDLREGNRYLTSSFFGDNWSGLLRGSDVGSFYLIPGNNTISVLITTTGSPTITAYLQWRNTHWSADGVAA